MPVEMQWYVVATPQLSCRGLTAAKLTADHLATGSPEADSARLSFSGREKLGSFGSGGGIFNKITALKWLRLGSFF